MAVIADFALETSTTTGTGTYSLAGAVSGLRTLVAALGAGTIEYVARTASYSKWERCSGTLTDAAPDTLSRTLIESSTGSLIDWQAGDAPIYIHCIPSATRLQEIKTHHRGSSAPTGPLSAGMLWIDTTGGVTALVWKAYTAAAAWVTLWTQNESTGAYIFPAGVTVTGAASFLSTVALSANPSTVLQAAPKQYVDQGDRKLIWGLTYANNGSDATNDIDIAAGGCMDATGAYWIALSAITKRLDASWTVGTNQGGLDTGAVGNNDYYIWAIYRSDTGLSDALFSLSSTAPTMPANYDYKRLIGWIKRTGAANVAFTTSEMEGGGLDFRWTTSRLDVDLTNTLTTSRRTDALSVPLNFSTIALIRTMLTDASATFNAIICSPDETDAAPSATAVPLLTHSLATAGGVVTGDMAVKTSSTGTIAARATLATVDAYRVATYGFQWSRR